MCIPPQDESGHWEVVFIDFAMADVPLDDEGGVLGPAMGPSFLRDTLSYKSALSHDVVEEHWLPMLEEETY